MKVIVQRVSRAKVTVEQVITGQIDNGILVLVAFRAEDNIENIKWMCNKLVNLRIFSDDNDKMNLSVQDINGGILLVSNFTLYGDVQRGFRPSFTDAARPEQATELYNYMLEYLKNNYNLQIEAGIFGAMMDLDFVNSGPVTIIIDK